MGGINDPADLYCLLLFLGLSTDCRQPFHLFGADLFKEFTPILIQRFCILRPPVAIATSERGEVVHHLPTTVIDVSKTIARILQSSEILRGLINNYPALLSIGLSLKNVSRISNIRYWLQEEYICIFRSYPGMHLSA